MTHGISAFSATSLGAAILLLAIPTVQAADAVPNTAAAFAGGGTFCFELGGQDEGQFQHLKFVAEPTSGVAPYNVIPVHAVERGSWKGMTYENTFTGTATEAPSANPKAPGAALLMSLNGGGPSYKPDGSPEIWVLQYAVELRADTLSGKIVGYEMESGAVVSGKPFSSDSMNFVQKDITPIDCTKF